MNRQPGLCALLPTAHMEPFRNRGNGATSLVFLPGKREDERQLSKVPTLLTMYLFWYIMSP